MSKLFRVTRNGVPTAIPGPFFPQTIPSEFIPKQVTISYPPCFGVGCSSNLVDQFSPSPCLLPAVLLKSYSFPRPTSNVISRKTHLTQNPLHSPLYSSFSNPQRPLLFGTNFIYTKDKISEGSSLCTMFQHLLRTCLPHQGYL